MSNLYAIEGARAQVKLEEICSVAQRCIRTYAENTIKSYSSRWLIFLDWYKEEGRDRSLVRFTEDDVDDFYAWFRCRDGFGERIQRKVKVCDNTCRAYAVTYSKIWDAILRHHRVIAHNPWKPSLKRFKVAPPLRRAHRATPPEKVSELLEAPDVRFPIGVRDRAILASLYGGAMRKSEVPALNLCDVTEDGEDITYRLIGTKNGSDIPIKIPSDFSAYIRAYLVERIKISNVPDEPFFIHYFGRRCRPVVRRVSGGAIEDLFNNYAAQVGLPPGITTHSGRKTAITMLLNEGVPHRDVAKFSRHASIQMVEKYDDDRLKDERNPYKKLRLTK